MYKSFFRRNTLCIARKNEAVQRKKDRCLGVLTVFRYALILLAYSHKSEKASKKTKLPLDKRKKKTIICVLVIEPITNK